MAEAISNTSPLLYLHRAGVLDCLGQLFSTVWIPGDVATELDAGRQQGYDVPDITSLAWTQTVEPKSIPSEWLIMDLGGGELAALAMALENPSRTLLIDDARARRVAKAAGLTIMGTLGVLLEAKSRGVLAEVRPVIERLEQSGMWISRDLRERMLALAGEHQTP